MDSLAARLGHLLEVSGLTYQDADDLAGLTRGHVGQIVRGTKPSPSGVTAVALALVFGATAEWLVAGRGQAPSQRRVREAVVRARAGSAA
jgi:transcriptional regulator with XRE-family HTH domain